LVFWRKSNSRFFKLTTGSSCAVLNRSVVENSFWEKLEIDRNRNKTNDPTSLELKKIGCLEKKFIVGKGQFITDFIYLN
jgi:hypothetical protein